MPATPSWEIGPGAGTLAARSPLIYYRCFTSGWPNLPNAAVPSSECLPGQQRGPVQRRRSTLHGSKPSDELARRPRTSSPPPISQKTFQKFACSRSKPTYPFVHPFRLFRLVRSLQIGSGFVKFDRAYRYNWIK